jgi:hypothetical protein
MSNVTTTTTTAAQPVWMVVTDWMVEPLDEMVDRTRSADGRFLKVNCKLESPKGGFSADKKAIADLYGEDVEMLFSARR